MHQGWRAQDQLDQVFAELICFLSLFNNIFPETQTLEALLSFKFITDHGQILGQHITIDDLEVFNLGVRLSENDKILLRFYAQRHVCED